MLHFLSVLLLLLLLHLLKLLLLLRHLHLLSMLPRLLLLREVTVGYVRLKVTKGGNKSNTGNRHNKT